MKTCCHSDTSVKKPTRSEITTTLIEYKERHNDIQALYEKLKSEKYYKQQPEPIKDEKKNTSLYDFAIRTDIKIKSKERLKD